jgi:hypothetical protein
MGGVCRRHGATGSAVEWVGSARIVAHDPGRRRASSGRPWPWEDWARGWAGVALVADDPDVAEGFEWDVEDVRSSFLADRETAVPKVGELGSRTRPAIQEALDGGLALLCYVGHGGSAVWASENVWTSWDALKLLSQSRQPLLLTTNCLNGYFVATRVRSGCPPGRP